MLAALKNNKSRIFAALLFLFHKFINVQRRDEILAHRSNDHG